MGWLHDNCLYILNNFDQAINCLQIPLTKLKTEVGSPKSKGKLFAHCHTDTIENPKRHFCSMSRLTKILFAYFPTKSLSYIVINSQVQKLSLNTMANITAYTETDITLQTELKWVRWITMCSKFDQDCCFVCSIFDRTGYLN